ncbi:hypothetical protein C9374_003789 [Naegleria lovaniensis]|uniref:Uncharacterized protein n=1 Tax=Naegleria lovaniensis TaxID=51637 RepID=A0AA88GZW5_NAELO|nr:uncharacterized protein C9374_003789 [Naegleria lovaniensis]KAG2394025.1 hypothetical protein C9374_003789 [Naegleria lovaniensis]
MSRFAVEQVMRDEEAIKEATKQLLKPKIAKEKPQVDPEQSSVAHQTKQHQQVLIQTPKQVVCLYPSHQNSENEDQNYSTKRNLLPKLTSFNLFLKKMNEISEERASRSPSSMSNSDSPQR